MWSQPNQNQLVSLWTQRSTPKKVSIKQNLTWGCFVQNFLFDSLFSSESYVFYHKNSSSFENLPFQALYSRKKGFGGAYRWCEVHFKPSFNAENLSFLVSRTLACTHMPVYAYACMKHVQANLEHACTYACMHTHALGFLWPFFSKNIFILPKISYIFHKYFLQVSFQLIRP